MEKGIVIQLQEEAIKEDVDIETLLRKAYLVARKLQLKKFENWVLNEQNGYKGALPEYRNVGGELQAFNPYRGWIPVMANGKMADFLDTMPINMPVAAISEAYSGSDGTIALTIPGEFTDFLNKNSASFDTKFRYKTSKTEFKKIISAVHNKILEWALLLEENGIVGEGLVFTDDEKKTAKNSSMWTTFILQFTRIRKLSSIMQSGLLRKN